MNGVPIILLQAYDIPHLRVVDTTNCTISLSLVPSFNSKNSVATGVQCSGGNLTTKSSVMMHQFLGFSHLQSGHWDVMVMDSYNTVLYNQSMWVYWK